MKRWGFVLVALLAGTGYAQLGHATVFSVDRVIGSGSVVGTVTTDGTLGVLSAGDLTDWDLMLSAGGSGFTLLGPLSGSNSQIDVTGSDLTATATELLFDFSGVGFALFQNPSIGSGTNWWCVEGPSSGCTPYGNSSSGTETVTVASTELTNYDSIQVIGSAAGAVPEGSTWAMMLLGFAGLGYARYRAHRSAPAASL
jgi:hypothetical protein